MSITDQIDLIRKKTASLSGTADLKSHVLKTLPRNRFEEEHSKEYILNNFLTPKSQFSEKWLNQLQEYV